MHPIDIKAASLEFPETWEAFMDALEDFDAQKYADDNKIGARGYQDAYFEINHAAFRDVTREIITAAEALPKFKGADWKRKIVVVSQLLTAFLLDLRRYGALVEDALTDAVLWTRLFGNMGSVMGSYLDLEKVGKADFENFQKQLQRLRTSLNGASTVMQKELLLYGLDVTINATNAYVMRVHADRSQQKFIKGVVDDSENWEIAADLYAEEIREEVEKGAADFIFHLPTNAEPFTEPMSIVFYREDTRYTGVPVSGYLMPTASLTKQDGFFKKHKSGMGPDARNSGQIYAPTFTTEMANLRFSINPGSLDLVLGNIGLDSTKRLLGHNYEVFRSYLLYALGSEVIAHYGPVVSPTELTEKRRTQPGEVNTDDRVRERTTDTKAQRKIIVGETNRSLEEAFESAQQRMTSRAEHTRLLRRGMPSERAYTNSKNKAFNPFGLELKAVLVQYDEVQAGFTIIELDNSLDYPTFHNRMKALREEYSSQTGLEIRFQTFVTPKVEDVVKSVRGGVNETL